MIAATVCVNRERECYLAELAKTCHVGSSVNDSSIFANLGSTGCTLFLLHVFGMPAFLSLSLNYHAFSARTDPLHRFIRDDRIGAPFHTQHRIAPSTPFV